MEMRSPSPYDEPEPSNASSPRTTPRAATPRAWTSSTKRRMSSSLGSAVYSIDATLPAPPALLDPPSERPRSSVLFKCSLSGGIILALGVLYMVVMRARYSKYAGALSAVAVFCLLVAARVSPPPYEESRYEFHTLEQHEGTGSGGLSDTGAFELPSTASRAWAERVLQETMERT